MRVGKLDVIVEGQPSRTTADGRVLVTRESRRRTYGRLAGRRFPLYPAFPCSARRSRAGPLRVFGEAAVHLGHKGLPA
jgi:hypothetical protein